jgi:hypothetical protein
MKHLDYLCILVFCIFVISCSSHIHKMRYYQISNTYDYENYKESINQFGKCFVTKGSNIPFFLYTKVSGFPVDSISVISSIQALESVCNTDFKNYMIKFNGVDSTTFYELLKFQDSILYANEFLGLEFSTKNKIRLLSYKIVDSTLLEVVRGLKDYDDNGKIIRDTTILDQYNLTLKKQNYP